MTSPWRFSGEFCPRCQSAMILNHTEHECSALHCEYNATVTTTRDPKEVLREWDKNRPSDYTRIAKELAAALRETLADLRSLESEGSARQRIRFAQENSELRAKLATAEAVVRAAKSGPCRHVNTADNRGCDLCTALGAYDAHDKGKTTEVRVQYVGQIFDPKLGRYIDLDDKEPTT